LVAAGIPVVSVKHGTGTAAWWLRIVLAMSWEEGRDSGLDDKAEGIAATVTGRDKWAGTGNMINVSYQD